MLPLGACARNLRHNNVRNNLRTYNVTTRCMREDYRQTIRGDNDAGSNKDAHFDQRATRLDGFRVPTGNERWNGREEVKYEYEHRPPATINAKNRNNNMLCN